MAIITVDMACERLYAAADANGWSGKGEIPKVDKTIFAFEHCRALGCPALVPDQGKTIRLACNRGVDPVRLYGDPANHTVDRRCPTPKPS